MQLRLLPDLRLAIPHSNQIVVDAAVEALRQFGLGPAAHAKMPIHAQTEELLEEYFGCEKAASVTSGYLAISALLLGLRDDYDVVFADEASHFSVSDGLRATGKPVLYFRHRDPQDLSEKLKNNLKPRQVALVLSEGVSRRPAP
ncbi:pyridoxal phosphate-dependent aminotransferase family protein [Sinorhizobium meliloti]|nr:pyridoxal phosphate-dependent aminotransferase family protein [Sinorhizobium meliloti]